MDAQAVAMTEEIAEQIMGEVEKTGRDPAEVLQCLIDEGYVDPDREARDAILARCSRKD